MSRRPNFGGRGMGGMNMQQMMKQAKKLKDIKIDKEAIDPDDPDMLQDLVIDAVNKGLSQIDEATQASLGKYTKGLM